jgi:anti-sigma B factor antagonist
MKNHFTVELLPCRIDGAEILRPVGNIDAAAAPILESHFTSLRDQSVNTIVIDFSKVEFISSAGIGIFLGSVSLLRKSGGDIVFMNVPKHVDEVFDVINVKSFFTTIENLDEVNTLTR